MAATYLVDETLELIRSLEKDLALHKLDPKSIDFTDFNTRRKVHDLVQNLETLLGAGERDPRLLAFVTRVQGLKDFLSMVQEALKGHKKMEEWLVRQKTTPKQVNESIDKIIASLEEWAILRTKKITAHLQNKVRNKYLEHLPKPEDPDCFYVMVKELNPLQVRILHPIDARQVARQQARTSEELMAYDSEEPISGSRFFEHGDSALYPGSGIRITDGHHRVFEICKRYLRGEIDGDKLVKLKKVYPR